MKDLYFGLNLIKSTMIKNKKNNRIKLNNFQNIALLQMKDIYNVVVINKYTKEYY